MEWKLLGSFPSDLSFCINTVLPLVIHHGVSPFRQSLRCHTRFLCKLVKFFSQNPWTPPIPGAFRFGIFFNIFFSFSCEICARAYVIFPFIFFLISLNQVASLSCSISWPQISVKMFLLLVNQVLQSLLPIHFHLFAYKINPHYF